MVYEPQEDSELMISAGIKAYGRVLDMGTGSGVLALSAARNPRVASVDAVDIDKQAIRHCLKKSCDRKIRYYVSNLFSDVSGSFDFIMFNPPYLPTDQGVQDKAIYGGRKGYEILERFIGECSGHLKSDGNVIILFSTLTGKAKVEQIIRENLLDFLEVSSQKHFFETLYVYSLKKSRLRIRLEESGIKDIRYHRKGRRGFIFRGKMGHISVAVKVRNPKSRSPNLMSAEADFISRLNLHGIGPKLILAKPDFMVMEFLDGVHLVDYLKRYPRSMTQKVVDDLERQVKIMDSLGINKYEFSRPTKNVIVVDEKPILIDFERCRLSTNPKNMRQFDEFKKRAGF